MAEKKIGRPSNGKTIRIQVAVSEEVKAKLEEAAKRERRSMSMLCSIVLEEWVNAQKAEQ
jgi:predicted transcriptional regulator